MYNVPPVIYFDNAASTPLLPIALERLNELNATIYGNSSSSHKIGRLAQEILSQAQEKLGRHFKVPPQHILFTSGGTESNNLAIWGALGGLTQGIQWLSNTSKSKLITSCIEHDSVKNVFAALEQLGASISWIKVNSEGSLDLNHLESELNSRTKLISIHHIQNEIGVIQDLKTICSIIRKKQPDALIHTDTVQSFLKIPIDFEELGIDLLSISGHKIGGPKGIGVLVLGPRFQTRNPKLGNLLYGSTHQWGIRPGTVPVPSIGGLCTAIDWGIKNFDQNLKHITGLRDHFIKTLPAQVLLNGPANTSLNRSPQTINFSIPQLPASVTLEALAMQGYCVSAGSACHSTNPKPNETLLKMGLGKERALSSIRVSLAHNNTLEEVDGFTTLLIQIIKQHKIQ